jgi:hypothetical protein
MRINPWEGSGIALVLVTILAAVLFYWVGH